ncbi:hypothetical protein BXT86_02665 [candidate division WOR-3 bacterium 4484_100]|uniref:Uncharacterized protein n=1 Tax=candidate division WOR-3 bacterium 4484_100 TaxID=1936077 RepID=A0A1V4QFL4_UNCW3|nr:MAG: hypothetical protein BXT86_02665 [candidate division WOR-3 bacterium 4484_100]
MIPALRIFNAFSCGAVPQHKNSIKKFSVKRRFIKRIIYRFANKSRQRKILTLYNANREFSISTISSYPGPEKFSFPFSYLSNCKDTKIRIVPCIIPNKYNYNFNHYHHIILTAFQLISGQNIIQDVLDNANTTFKNLTRSVLTILNLLLK